MSLKRNPSRTVVNFAAGPSALPYEVLERAQQEFLDFENTGSSVMEISHRSGTFSKIMAKAEKNVRELLKVPDNYRVLFLQGGGNGQFASVALNLINRNPKRSADYLVTGYWSERAAVEAKKYGNVNLVLPKFDKYTDVPLKDWKVDPEASYVYICENETINGVEFNDEHIDYLLSVYGNVPLVADCCSNLFSRPIDVTKYGLIFAGAQKNFGPAGVTLVIVRDDLLSYTLNECPTIFDYKIQSGNNSLFQTPPSFGIYICNLVFEWLLAHGGMEKVGEVNKLKSQLLYETIDESNGFYFSPIDQKCRSRMNIPIRIYIDGKLNEKVESEFISQAESNHKLKELKGHRSVGGIRASIFNALSYEEVQSLTDYMKQFRAKHIQTA